MNIVIAIDSFKGCISSVDSGRLLKQAIEEVYPGDVVSVFPLADGGEGTVDAMTQGLNGRIVKAPVTGPLGTKVESRYGLLPDTKTAVIEMADASGLPLVPPEKRNPLHTTTYGLGELILAAIDAGCRHFIIGIDGKIIQCIPLDEKSSASNDRNIDTLSIEVCHPDETGKFNQASYDSLVKLTAWLCDYTGIGRDQVIRHYDITGKLCPLYFVEHKDAWNQFLQDVADYK